MERDQDQHFVRPDLGLNCLADDTSRQRANSVENNVDSYQLLSGSALFPKQDMHVSIINKVYPGLQIRVHKLKINFLNICCGYSKSPS